MLPGAACDFATEVGSDLPRRRPLSAQDGDEYSVFFEPTLVNLFAETSPRIEQATTVRQSPALDEDPAVLAHRLVESFLNLKYHRFEVLGKSSFNIMAIRCLHGHSDTRINDLVDIYYKALDAGKTGVRSDPAQPLLVEDDLAEK